MAPRFLLAALAALVLHTAQAQVVDPNLQNLLTALSQGTEVTLMTPLQGGMVQVTSFVPSMPIPRQDAAAAVETARQHLSAAGIDYPTGDQLAAALIGGPVNAPGGQTTMSGVLPMGTRPATIRSYIAQAAAPQVAPSAAAGGTAPPAAQPAGANLQARELAIQQLASIGIINPAEDQIRTALLGGVISTVNGMYRMPGIMQQPQPLR